MFYINRIKVIQNYNSGNTGAIARKCHFFYYWSLEFGLEMLFGFVQMKREMAINLTNRAMIFFMASSM